MRRSPVAAVALAFALLGASPWLSPARAGASAPTQTTGTWTSLPRVVGTYIALDDVSCVSSSFCMVLTEGATGHPETSYVWDGRSWSRADDFSGYYPPLYMSCASPRMCIGVALQGYYTLWDGTHWGPETQFDPDQQGTDVGLSCASATLCVVVDSDKGTALIFNGKTWSTPAAIDPTVAAATAEVNKGKIDDAINMTVACAPRSATCAVLDGAGDTVVLSGGKWVAKGRLSGLSEHAADGPWLSCPQSNWCMANGSTAKATGYWTWGGGSWSRAQAVKLQYSTLGQDINPFSCASSQFCGGFTTEGWALYGAGTWHATVGSLSSADALSCPTDKFCLAVGTGAAWSWKP